MSMFIKYLPLLTILVVAIGFFDIFGLPDWLRP